MIWCNELNLSMPPLIYVQMRKKYVSNYRCACRLIAQVFLRQIDKIFIIGGARLYREAMHHPDCAKLHLTRVYKTFDWYNFYIQVREHYLTHSR